MLRNASNNQIQLTNDQKAHLKSLWMKSNSGVVRMDEKREELLDQWMQAILEYILSENLPLDTIGSKSFDNCLEALLSIRIGEDETVDEVMDNVMTELRSDETYELYKQLKKEAELRKQQEGRS
ncbi:hypothetical protein CANARDRAFT_10394 [[Candida] arabinofermentans NRRL YB-2248]|uniref:Uncharacterized protein n=1 Tax=[Candida] arabinofermentans NRRL YB-2248 TaxID=983967 RepID=A0A1E4SSV9_9ASCO|nr:hypothetical protein CANARDRAFT_10394 [[Candida] arabinofermentans NRRL YB-2248]